MFFCFEPESGGNSLNRTYVEEVGVHVRGTGKNKGEGEGGWGQKLEVLSGRTF